MSRPSRDPPLPEIGQRTRFAIEYNGAWRPLGWVRAGKDGSIYVGSLTGKPTSAQELEKAAEKLVKINYRELRDLSKLPTSSRLSFHPSGEVHIGDKIVRGLVPLEKLHKPLQLCIMTFSHPRTYQPLSGKKTNEFDLRIADYRVDEERPTYGAIIVAPWTPQVQLPAKLPNMTTFVGAAIGLRGFTKTADLLIGIVLGHGPKGPWPTRPGVGVLYRAA
jgi:hypothetical protein